MNEMVDTYSYGYEKLWPEPPDLGSYDDTIYPCSNLHLEVTPYSIDHAGSDDYSMDQYGINHSYNNIRSVCNPPVSMNVNTDVCPVADYDGIDQSNKAFSVTEMPIRYDRPIQIGTFDSQAQIIGAISNYTRITKLVDDVGSSNVASIRYSATAKNAVQCSSTDVSQHLCSAEDICVSSSSSQNYTDRFDFPPSSVSDVYDNIISKESIKSSGSHSLPRRTTTLHYNAPEWASYLIGATYCEKTHTYIGYLKSKDELDRLFQALKESNPQQSWGTRQSSSRSKSSIRYMWSSEYVPYDAIPFTNVDSRATVKECQYGQRRKSAQKRSSKGSKRSRKSATGNNSSSDETLDCCPAKICIKKVKKFLQYRIREKLEGKKLREAKQKALSSLKKVDHGQLNPEIRYYVRIPTNAAHKCHPDQPQESPEQRQHDNNLVVPSPKAEDSSNNAQDSLTFADSNTANRPKGTSALVSPLSYVQSCRVSSQQQPLREIERNNVSFEDAILPNNYDKPVYSVSNPIRNYQFANEKYLNVSHCESNCNAPVNMEYYEPFTRDTEQYSDPPMVTDDTDANYDTAIYTSSYDIDQDTGFGNENFYMSLYAPASLRGQ